MILGQSKIYMNNKFRHVNDFAIVSEAEHILIISEHRKTSLDNSKIWVINKSGSVQLKLKLKRTLDRQLKRKLKMGFHMTLTGKLKRRLKMNLKGNYKGNLEGVF